MGDGGGPLKSDRTHAAADAGRVTGDGGGGGWHGAGAGQGSGAAPFLEIKGLSVEYGGGSDGRDGALPLRALDGATLSAGRGECVGIAGASACGKSTLGLAVMRSLRGGTVTGGSIALGGQSVLDEDGGGSTRGGGGSEYRWCSRGP